MAESVPERKIEITGVLEQRVINDETGKSQQVLRVQFNVGEFGPYFIDFPKDTLDNAKIVKEVEDRGKTIRAIIAIT